MSAQQKKYGTFMEEKQIHIRTLQQLITLRESSRAVALSEQIDNKSKYVYSKRIHEAKPGIFVQYGTYPISGSCKDKTPIAWLVLKVQGNRALLLSLFGLDAHCFNPTEYQGWDKSEIRAWLNDSFLKKAFTSEEQLSIATTKISTPSYHGNSGGSDTEDKLWLLSHDEVTTYLTNDESRKCIPTMYAVKKGAWQYGGSNRSYMIGGMGCCWWWLRSPGFDSNRASLVSNGGHLDYYGTSSSNGSVRPAFWLNLDSVAIDK